jgi:outer membrane lipoprotein carrier protein
MKISTMLRVTLTVVLLALVPFASAAQSRQTPDALAKALQARYQGVRDFSADFVQTYRGGVLKTQTRETGTVAVKKPGRMRWIYSTSPRKELVSDGTNIYWYVPEDRQVIVYDAPSDQATTPALFLSGKGDIVRDFTASAAEPAVPGTLGLKLVPRRREQEYEYLIVSLDPANLQIRALLTKDRQGGESTLMFNNMKENRGLSDKDFVFRIPRGVNVVNDATR